MIPEKLNRIVAKRGQKDRALIERAYEFAKIAHEGQLRRSGEPYINHPLGVAVTLAELNMDTSSIAAGLLHDVPEDTEFTIRDIERDFNDDIASLVDGITKVGTIKYRGVERYMENLRRMFIAMARDIRVIVIKFADRIYNLETLGALPPEKRLRIAKESLEIYAPIANRLGMGEIKGKLEDLAFPHVLPKEYEWVKRIYDHNLAERESALKQARRLLIKQLERERLPVISVHSRIKRMWSLYRKLLEHNRDISSIYDLVAMRVIVESVSDCYAVLGSIHQMWKPLKGRIKDYIATPKPNGYRSLHTTVFCTAGQIIEIQIRTKEMHEEAEYGIAAYWNYKERGSKIPKEKLRWVEELTRWRKELEADEAYLESLKIDVFQNRIFIFTPKGDVIDLPEGATAIDFAYAVHTDIGHHANGVYVNDELDKLDKPLKSGDVVRVLTDKKRPNPSPDWLGFAKTNSAREKIKSALNKKNAGLLNKWVGKK